MTNAISVLPSSGLDAFLFADVGTEANHMTLSVLSLLARLDHDPWLEAGRLAALPRPRSIEALALAINEMPGSRWSISEAVPIATRLVALLPKSSIDPRNSRALLLPRDGRAGPSKGRTAIAVASGLTLRKGYWLGIVILLSAVFAALVAGAMLVPSDSTEEAWQRTTQSGDQHGRAAPSHLPAPAKTRG